MANFFLSLLNLSITASYIALAAIILRLLLKRNPKWITCLLWALVAVKLLVPFSFESRLSLVPDTAPVKVNAPASSVSASADTSTLQTPVIDRGDTPDIPVTPVTPITPDKSEDTPAQDNSPVISDTTTENAQKENNTNIYSVLSYIWIGGAVCMLLYSVVSYLRIKKKVQASIRTNKNIYICDDISTPFILGIIKPRIYLPSALAGDELEYIVNHEKAHLKRCDHLWKPLGFVLLSLHWFNPLMWISYILLCRDIELACDEKVLKNMGANTKKHYSETLLTFSTERKLVSACPLAFGEVGVKGRIKNILNYKKPAFWVTILSLFLCLAIGICFLTNPVSEKESSTESTKSDVIENLPDILPADCITDNYILYTYTAADNSAKNSYIKLYPEDNSFELMLSPLSSYLPMGKFTIEGKKLTLECDSDDNVYTFKFLDSYTLEFIQDESAELPKYKYSEEDTETSPPFGDRTHFAIEGTKHKGGEQPAETTIPYTYEEIVENIIDAYPWESDDGSAPIPDLLPHTSYMYLRQESLSEVGYALIDLDNNGTNELILSDFTNDYVYDVYTYVDGETVHLFSSGERYAHYLYENGYIEYQWSSGAAISGHDFMRLSNGKLEFIERITLDAYYAEESGVIEKLEDAGSDNTFFKSASRNTKNYIHISDDEALALIDTHKNKTPRLEFSLIPLSDYKHGDIPPYTNPNRAVSFDIDGDGEYELCDIGFESVDASDYNTKYTLIVNDNGKTEHKTIWNLVYDTERNTIPYVYLKSADQKLYVFVEHSAGSRLVYRLDFSQDKITGTDMITLCDIVDFDIDNDGDKETLTLSTLPIFAYSSSEYCFSLQADANGVCEYYNEFVLPTSHSLQFAEADGKLCIITTTLDESASQRSYSVTLNDGNIALTCDGDTIPYNSTEDTSVFTQSEWSDYSTQWALDHVIDQMTFDIDKDGNDEDVIIGAGGTYGRFTFRIIAKEGDEIKYNSFFVSNNLDDLYFEKDENGIVYLKGEREEYATLNGEVAIGAASRNLELRVQGTQILLYENGVQIQNTQL